MKNTMRYAIAASLFVAPVAGTASASASSAETLTPKAPTSTASPSTPKPVASTPLPSKSTSAPSKSTSSNDPVHDKTVYVVSDRSQYVFTATSNGTTVGALHGGDAVVGTYYPSTSWLQIKSGTYAGKWIWKPSLTATPKPVAKDIKRFTGTANVSQKYDQAHTGSTKRNVIAPVSSVQGDLYSNGWFQVRSGGFGYLQGTMSSNPYSSYETRQWNNTTGYQAMAPTNSTVKRYAVLNRVNVPVRAGTSLTSTIMARMPSGTALTGKYVDSHWFKITSGTYSGKYVSSGVLFTNSSQTAINGKLKAEDLCDAPGWMRLEKTQNDQFIGCESLIQLLKLDTKLKSVKSQGIMEWEGYRNFATQTLFYKQFGYPQAAVPGTSNHGLGNAIDIRYSKNAAISWGTPVVKNISNYGPSFGWVKPAYLKQSGSYSGEPWHFEFNG